MNPIILPFKPFTFAEVCDALGVPPQHVERWIAGNALEVKWGEVDRNDRGLDDRGAFAAFVGWRYLQEGADDMRARWVVMAVASLPWDHLASELREGRSYLTRVGKVGGGHQAFLADPAKVDGVSESMRANMRRLNLRQLLGEFNMLMRRKFPDHSPAVDVEGKN